MKAMWSGSIEFGLVNIPVRLYSATEESELKLHMLDKKDLSTIRYKRVNANTGKEVDWKNIVRAYKYDGSYIVLEDKDFEAASAKKSQVIEIESFVMEKEIETTFYEKPYYLEPTKPGAHAYELFREALKNSQKVGVGTFVFHNKEHLAILKPSENVIILNRIRFQQEIRNPAELTLPVNENLKPKELEMALLLVDQLTTDFDVKKYKDTYTEALMKVIKAKAKGSVIKPVKMKVVHTASGDLIKQLEKSLAARKRAA
ncbi:MAG: Ku protein [Acidobacteria bacterium]|jgi:DNA end-binding protein Ku|nr:Ku protein [Acidobacteriota bacterium]